MTRRHTDHGSPTSRWWADAVLGIRIAVGGIRKPGASVLRLAFGTVGIGLAVTLLFLAASMGTALQEQDEREDDRRPLRELPAQNAALHMAGDGTEYRGRDIAGDHFEVTGEDPPVPPGVDELPGPGEIVLSPALADLLDSDEGALLRPRFDQQVVGTIAPEGLSGPNELRFYAGDRDVADSERAFSVVGFGDSPPDTPTNIALVMLIAFGGVVLLVPLFVFISTSSRIAGDERDRSLATIRLLGADGRQVRRIAATESLVTAVSGACLGALLFLLVRQAAPHVVLGNRSLFAADIVPPWHLVALILSIVPILAVATTLFGLRRTVIQPLGVARKSKPVRRKLWWRLLLALGGIALLIAVPAENANDRTLVIALSGAALLLGAIPALMPWLIESVMARVRGGRPSWQLASRRLQLDSGTPARVVGGVVIVLAGAIGLQSMVLSVSEDLRSGNVAQADENSAEVVTLSMPVSEAGEDAQLTHRLQSVPGVDSIRGGGRVPVRGAGDRPLRLYVAGCDSLRADYRLPACQDGDVFGVDNRYREGIPPDREVTQVEYTEEQEEKVVGRWTIPSLSGEASPTSDSRRVQAELLLTPEAFDSSDLGSQHMRIVTAELPSDRPDAAEEARNAVAPLAWRVDVAVSGEADLSELYFGTIRSGLYAGSVLVMLLAAASLLVLGTQQIAQRRRALAALAASGVPSGVLARSLLWQNTVPIGIGVVVAAIVGTGLAALGARLAGISLVVDWQAMGALTAGAVLLVLLVTVATLPTLRSAMKLDGLRTE